MKKNSLSVLSAALVLSACQNNDKTGETATAEPDESIGIVASVEDRLGLGREVYGQACASCHETGAGGAPKTGDQNTWSGRSSLWTAVLSEHAKNGYLDMPSKGGDETLSDEGIAAATDYMLSKTFPELPGSE